MFNRTLDDPGAQPTERSSPFMVVVTLASLALASLVAGGGGYAWLATHATEGGALSQRVMTLELGTARNDLHMAEIDGREREDGKSLAAIGPELKDMHALLSDAQESNRAFQADVQARLNAMLALMQQGRR